jgi:Big-like domain-containing protein
MPLGRSTLIVGLVGLAAYGGGEIRAGSGQQADSNATISSTVREKNTIECNGRLAGTLVLEPTVVEPGGEVRVAVKNVGEVTIYYGLGNRVERRVNRRWEDATEDVYGTRHPGVRRILLSARPGKRAGPRYNENLVDRIPLPRDLAPGTYRVIKRANGDPRHQPPRLKLEATFEVRAP